MLRISIYHWMPIADNMLPEIHSAITDLGHTSEIHQDSVIYESSYIYKLENSQNNSINFSGKINQRGFSQIVLELYPIKGMTLSSILNDIVPNFVHYTAEFLLSICPFAVRNKFAVIHEGIVSFQQFETVKFESQIMETAIASIKKHSIISILIDDIFINEIREGFDIPSLKMKFKPNGANTFVITNEEKNCFLIYSNTFSKEELYPFDGIIYKYCALLTYNSFVVRVIQLLKDTRDHVIPLRRQLAIALQRRTEEYLNVLVRIKRYFSYINIKLPVVNKALNHLQDALISKQFKAKINTFSTEKISLYPVIEFVHKNLHDETLLPNTVIEKIEESAGRLQKLFAEIDKEVNQFSSELALVLQGNFLSENVQKLTKVTQTLRNQLEVARAGKNRENALKLLSVLLFANFGVLFAREFLVSGLSLVLIAVISIFLAYIYTESVIRSKGAYFQVEIPINKNLSRLALRNLTENLPAKRLEVRGRGRQKTWGIHLFTYGDKIYKKIANREINLFNAPWYMKIKGLYKNFKEFDISLDYEKHGYVHSIILETEHNKVNFDVKLLVFQIVYMLHSSGILDTFDMSETSLYAEMLTGLDIFVDRKLQGLNFILTVPSDELERALNSNPKDDASLNRHDKHIIENIQNNLNEYLFWLTQKNSQDSLERVMYGEKNLESKTAVIRLTNMKGE